MYLWSWGFSPGFFGGAETLPPWRQHVTFTLQSWSFSGFISNFSKKVMGIAATYWSWGFSPAKNPGLKPQLHT
jgi:hypothetical protein